MNLHRLPRLRLRTFFSILVMGGILAGELVFAAQIYHEKRASQFALARFTAALTDPAGVFDERAVLASEDEAMDADSVIDFLLLGRHGTLTDTILLASVDTHNKSIHLLSIPRDFYVGGRRINSIYSYEGFEPLSDALLKITGRTVDHLIDVDMDGFEQGIDGIGGVDVYVPKAIYDSTYPAKQGGYEIYSIEPGAYHMSGEEALKYARSRHGSSDFDRAERQQRILNAARTRVNILMSEGELTPLISLIESMIQNVKTDMSVLTMADYALRFHDFDLRRGLVLSTSNYLYSETNENGAYMLLPLDSDYSDIHDAVARELL